MCKGVVRWSLRVKLGGISVRGKEKLRVNERRRAKNEWRRKKVRLTELA